ncbi:hypothetical protein [Streptomyces sp. cg35]|uniref:hypothetical protein n=1 Tax=Streptomyces sp. cg35 TaxID=3421650 RepID=UPI003D17C182
MGVPHERWHRQALIPTSRTSPDTPSSTPTYASLVDEWRALGKTLPDQFDAEWSDIVSRDFWNNP